VRFETTDRKYSKAKKTCNRVRTNCNQLARNLKTICVADKRKGWGGLIHLTADGQVASHFSLRLRFPSSQV
jgi:hypothetical protein